MRIFSVILPVRVSGLLLSEFLISYLCYLAACFVFVSNASDYLVESQGWLRIFLVSVSILIGLFVTNLYAHTRPESRVALVLRLCRVLGIALIGQGLLAYISSGLILPRSVMLAGSAFALLALLGWRLFYGSVILNMIGTSRVLFLGRDSVLDEIAARIRTHPELGYGIAGYLAERSFESTTAMGEYLGPVDNLETVVRDLRPDRVIVGALGRGWELPVPLLLRMARQGIVIEEAATAFEAVCGRVCSRELRPSQVIFYNELASRPGSVALQSIYTNLLALAAIIFTSPVLLIAALAIKLTSRGPLLEKDVRVGLHGIPFSLHRFRCHFTERTPLNSQARLTPVGKWLQRLHLVNLPRLFNLLRGEVTLVGPKPERPEFANELSHYFAYYQQRHSIKPGMTGWSQIHSLTEDEPFDSLRQIEYDLYYTKHISLPLDAYILLHGIRSALPFARH